MFVFALALYSNTLNNAFVFDDHTLIVHNPHILGMRSWPKLFTQGYWPEEMGEKLYRPLTMLSYGVNRRLLGRLDPSPYHAVNILLHGANAALVCALVLRLFGAQRRLLALAAGLFFAVHPLQADAVAPVYGRAELLAAFFYLLALWFWVRDPQTKPVTLNWAASLGAFALGLLSKETAITLPAALLLCDWTLGRLRRQHTRALPIRYGGLAAVIVLYLLARWHALGALTTAQFYFSQPLLRHPLPSPFTVGAIERWATACAVIGRYALLLLWPARLSPDYSYAAVTIAQSLASSAVWLPASAALISIAGAFWLAKRDRALAFAVLFFWVAFSVVSNFIVPTGAWMAERFLYLPMFGVAILAGRGVEKLTKLRLPDAVVLGLLVGALALCSVRTFLRNRHWRDGATLWSSAVRAQPRSVVVLHNWGESLLAGGQPARAAEIFRQALEISPGMSDTHTVLSRALLQLRQFDAAISAAQRALALRPGSALAHNNLGLALMGQGDFTGAVRHLRVAAEALPGMYDTWNNLGVALFNVDRFDEAIQAYETALRLAPGNASAHFNYGLALLRLARPAEAAQQFGAALRHNPGLTIAHMYLAQTSAELGDLAGAERHLRAGTEAEPANAAFYLALAQLYAATGRTNEAMQAAAHAQRLQGQPPR